jgi:hypothetical protein
MTEQPEDQGGPPPEGRPKGPAHRRTRRGRDAAPDEPGRLDRRRFIGWTAAGGAAIAAAAFGIVEATGNDGKDGGEAAPPGRGRRKGADHQPTSGGPPPDPIVGPHEKPSGAPTLPVSPAIIAENAKTGHAWWVTTPQQPGDIEGYASQVSAVAGETVQLFVSTKATSFHVEAYRMGYYQGIGGRLVWNSAELPGTRQSPPVLVQPTNTIECQWNPSLAVTIGDNWPPGAYLLKLVGATGEQQFVPLCVRDDASRAAIVIQHSVTTWQAYNRWGGYSLYYGNRDGALSYTHQPGGGTFADRARVVSFDRPYDHDWASGAADFVGNELPVLYQAEQLGLDVTYWTDIDLHVQPELLTNHRALLSLGHDEYWSQPMRDGAASALASGVNLAFLGANACYRQIRLQASSVGPNRLQVCYKSATEDPMTAVDPSLVTVNWPDAPVSRPESQLIGSTYQDVEAQADMVVVDPGSWLFKHIDLPASLRFPKVVQGEFDRYVPGGTGPTNLDVIAHSVVPNRGNNFSDVTWYTVPGGGGVFATGNASWVGALSDSTLIPPNVLPDATPGVTDTLLAVMGNLYTVIGSGPASSTNPSQGNWRTAYGAGSPSGPTPGSDETA